MVGDEGETPAPLLLAPADEPIARLEVEGRGAPGGQRQPVPLIRGDLAQMLADHAVTFEIVMRDHAGVIAGGFVGLDQAHREVLQDLRFVGTSPTFARLRGKMRIGWGFGRPEGAGRPHIFARHSRLQWLVAARAAGTAGRAGRSRA